MENQEHHSYRLPLRFSDEADDMVVRQEAVHSIGSGPGLKSNQISWWCNDELGGPEFAAGVCLESDNWFRQRKSDRRHAKEGSPSLDCGKVYRSCMRVSVGAVGGCPSLVSIVSAVD